MSCEWDLLPHLGAHEGGILDAVREVVEALALAVDVGGGAVQAAAERVGVAQVAGDDVHAQLVHLLLLVDLGGLHDDGLRVEDQAVHGQPHGGVAQRRRLGVRGLGGLDDLPVVGLEDRALLLGQLALRVVDDQAGAQRHEGRVDVDRVGVAGEVHGVHAVLGVVALEPVHGGAVGGQAVLDEQVLAHAHHVGGVPHRLDLGGHEVLVGGAHQALLQRDLLVVVVVLVGLVGQARARGLGPQEVRVLVEVLLHERPVGQVLEVAAAEGVGGGHDLVAHGEQDVAGRHAGHHRVVAEVGRWGTPLPIWRSEEGEELCIGSVEELYNEIEKSIAAGFMTANPYKEKGFIPGEYTEDNYDKIDLHRPYVDDIILVSESGKPMKREADLIDVWFDSGAMPYAQLHYPFENKDIVDNRSYYPADFIAEGVDQTRGWFFTLHAIATMVFDSVAYKNVISNGLVLDKNGNKMSKRLGNAVDPFGAIEQYGSDPLRWYMITNSSPWDNLKFDTDGVMEVTRKFFGTLHNTYKFFAPYANLDGFTYQEADVPMSKRPEIDRWILSELNSLIKNVDMCYADYEPTKAGRLINDFVNDNLSNWYVRLCRKRFWGTGYTEDKLAAYQTLYVCLETVAKLMAPIAPFYADKLYMDLIATTGRDHVASVHLADFPVCDETVIDKELETRMELAQKVSSMGLALRKKINIIVKQPLQKLMIPVDALMKERLESVKSLIMNEVNVKEIDFVEGTSNLLVQKVKCNFKILGKKFGSLMKQVAAAVTAMNQEQISVLENEGKIVLDLNGTPAEIETSEVEIFSEDIPGWVVANEGVLTVALDTVVTEELRREGIARELVSKIQNIRKGSGFEITDKIKVSLSKNEQTDSAVKEYNTYICNQVLANSLNLVDEVKDGIELSFDDFSLYVSVVKE